MIIQPDFVDHYKTRRLCKQAGDSAVLALLRLWGVCQQRRQWVFDTPPDAVEMMAQWGGDAGVFWKALVDCRWVDVLDGGRWEMHDWADNNRQLVTRWENGNCEKSAHEVASRPLRSRQAAGKRTASEAQADGSGGQADGKRTASEAQADGSGGQAADKRTASEAQADGSGGQADGKRTGGDIDIDIENIKKKVKKKKGKLAASVQSGVAAFRRKASELLEPLPEEILTAYENWAQYRALKRAMITRQAGERHFAEVMRCLGEGLSIAQVVGMFQKSEDSGWTGWFFPEELLKIKAGVGGFCKEKYPPYSESLPGGVPSGVIPSGAMGWEGR